MRGASSQVEKMHSNCEPTSETPRQALNARRGKRKREPQSRWVYTSWRQDDDVMEKSLARLRVLHRMDDRQEFGIRRLGQDTPIHADAGRATESYRICQSQDESPSR
jgi:hypothetical protein